MSDIYIDDGNDEEYYIGLVPLINLEDIIYVVNPRECGISLANKYYDDELSDTEIEEIVDGLLSELHKQITEEFYSHRFEEYEY